MLCSLVKASASSYSAIWGGHQGVCEARGNELLSFIIGVHIGVTEHHQALGIQDLLVPKCCSMELKGDWCMRQMLAIFRSTTIAGKYIKGSTQYTIIQYTIIFKIQCGFTVMST